MKKVTSLSKYRRRYTVSTMAKQLSLPTDKVIEWLKKLGINKSKPTEQVTPDERHHAFQYIKNNLDIDASRFDENNVAGNSIQEELHHQDDALAGHYEALHSVIKAHAKDGSPIDTSQLREAIQGVPPSRFIEDINCMDEMIEFTCKSDTKATLLRSALSELGHDVDFGHRGWLSYNGLRKPRNPVDIELAFVTAATLSQMEIDELSRNYPEMAYALYLSLSKTAMARQMSTNDIPTDHDH